MRLQSVLLLSALSVAACGGSSAPAATPATPASVATPASTPSTTAAAAAPAGTSAALDSALANVDVLLTNPSRALIEKSLAPSFFEHVSEDKVSQLLDQVHGSVGACTRAGVDDRTDTTATAHYTCAKGGIDAHVAVANGTDPKIIGLVLKPR
jgi:hypothetical protein